MAKEGGAAVEAGAMLLLGTAAVVAWTGGWRVDIFGVTISIRGAGRLAAFGFALVAVRAALSRDRLAPTRELADVVTRVIAGALLVVGLLGWATHLSPYVGGADSYGYVSAAERIRAGTLIESEPLAELLPYPNAIQAATPLGYVQTSRAANASVPAYPLGLPALMAVASAVAGSRAPLFVAPVMGLLLVGVCCWFVYRWTRDMTLTLTTTAAVAFNPVVFTYAIQPMSDVPAAACFLVAGALLFQHSVPTGANLGGVKALSLQAATAQATLAGASAGVALLIRPALAPGAVALGIIPMLSGPHRIARGLAFGVVLAVGVAALAWSQWYLYGSPLANGYGPASELFSLDFLAANARSYVYWTFAVHRPVWILGLTIAAMRIGTIRERALVALPLLAAAAPYAVYRTYDHWETLRFVLPLLVAATMAAVAGLFVLFRGMLPRAGTWLSLGVVMAIMSNWVGWLNREHVFERAISEERFARAGELVSRATPEDAVVLASLHSGSVRYYSKRQTLDWARIPSGQFDATVAALRQHGRAVFVMVDGQEERQQFEARHGDVIDSSRWLPSGQVRDVRLYEAPR